MIAYHVDRVNSLAPGMSLTLEKPQANEPTAPYLNDYFPDGISRAGDVYIGDLLFYLPDIAQRFKEIEFELARRTHFTDMPSRFQSFFCCKTMDSAQQWLKLLGPLDGINPIIWEVEIAGPTFELDAFWRDRKCSTNVAGYINGQIYCHWENMLDAHRYWSGIISDSPSLELMTSLSTPVIVKGPTA